MQTTKIAKHSNSHADAQLELELPIIHRGAPQNSEVPPPAGPLPGPGFCHHIVPDMVAGSPPAGGMCALIVAAVRDPAVSQSGGSWLVRMPRGRTDEPSNAVATEVPDVSSPAVLALSRFCETGAVRGLGRREPGVSVIPEASGTGWLGARFRGISPDS